MKTLLTLTTLLMLSAANSPAQTGSTHRVAFAQSCFWTGEMQLGQIEGVVRTEAGYYQGHEVTLVEYDPARLSMEQLAAQAKKAGVADRIYLPVGASSHGRDVAGVSVGGPLDRSYRTAPASDQKKQIEGTPFARLKLTPEVATKVNAFVRVDPARALQALNPAERAQMATPR